jgi:hypothetical protein
MKGDYTQNKEASKNKDGRSIERPSSASLVSGDGQLPDQSLAATGK